MSESNELSESESVVQDEYVQEISPFEFAELPSRSAMRKDENFSAEKEKNERRFAN
jgi:hypothetical protein